MSQLKPSFVNEIYSTLENSCFTRADFKLELPKSGSMLCRITFVHKPEYALSLRQYEKTEDVRLEQTLGLSTRTTRQKYIEFGVHVTPSKYKTEHKLTLEGIGELIDVIPQWCENIKADLYALAPQNDPLEELRKQINSELEELVQEPESFFSEEEATHVDERIDKLYEDFSSLKEEYSLSKKQLEELKKEFDEYKQSARAYPKGMWAKITANKLLTTARSLAKSPEARKLFFDGIRKAIGVD